MPKYSIEVLSQQNGLLHDVDARFGYPQVTGENPTPEFGVLIPRAPAADHFIPVPIPHRVRISWRTPDGVRHQREVQVLGIVPENFSGIIRFVVRADGNVAVEAREYSR